MGYLEVGDAQAEATASLRRRLVGALPRHDRIRLARTRFADKPAGLPVREEPSKEIDWDYVSRFEIGWLQGRGVPFPDPPPPE